MSSSVVGKLRGLFNSSRTATAIANKPRRRLPNLPTKSVPISNKDTIEHKPISERENALKRQVKKFKLYTESEKFRERFRPYETIVRRLVNEKKFALVEEIIEHQKKFPEISNEAFCVRLLVLYGQAGMFDHARKLFDEMPKLNCERTVMSINALLDAAVESKEFGKVDELVNELPGELGVKLDVISYNTVIKGFCQQGFLDEALKMIDVMEEAGVDADVVTFNTLFEAFCKSGRVDDADKIEEMMKVKNIEVNIRTINPKLRGLIAQKRIMDAVELFSKLDTMGLKPDVYSFNALVQGFRDEDNLKEAMRCYDEMIKCGISPDKATYAILVPFLCEKGESDAALKLCRKLIKECVLIPRKTLQMVVDELVSESKTDEAAELVQLGKDNKYFRYQLELLPDN